MITSKLVKESLQLVRDGHLEANSYLLRFMNTGQVILSTRYRHEQQLKANGLLFEMGFPCYELERSQQTVFKIRRSS